MRTIQFLMLIILFSSLSMGRSKKLPGKTLHFSSHSRGAVVIKAKVLYDSKTGLYQIMSRATKVKNNKRLHKDFLSRPVKNITDLENEYAGFYNSLFGPDIFGAKAAKDLIREAQRKIPPRSEEEPPPPAPTPEKLDYVKKVAVPDQPITCPPPDAAPVSIEPAIRSVNCLVFKDALAKYSRTVSGDRVADQIVNTMRKAKSTIHDSKYRGQFVDKKVPEFFNQLQNWSQKRNEIESESIVKLSSKYQIGGDSKTLGPKALAHDIVFHPTACNKNSRYHSELKALEDGLSGAIVQEGGMFHKYCFSLPDGMLDEGNRQRLAATDLRQICPSKPRPDEYKITPGWFANAFAQVGLSDVKNYASSDGYWTLCQMAKCKEGKNSGETRERLTTEQLTSITPDKFFGKIATMAANRDAFNAVTVADKNLAKELEMANKVQNAALAVFDLTMEVLECAPPEPDKILDCGLALGQYMLKVGELISSDPRQQERKDLLGASSDGVAALRLAFDAASLGKEAIKGLKKDKKLKEKADQIKELKEASEKGNMVKFLEETNPTDIIKEVLVNVRELTADYFDEQAERRESLIEKLNRSSTQNQSIRYNAIHQIGIKNKNLADLRELQKNIQESKLATEYYCAEQLPKELNSIVRQAQEFTCPLDIPKNLSPLLGPTTEI